MSDDNNNHQAATESQVLVELIRPLLAGRGVKVQGAALADLLAMWLAGHFVIESPELTAQMREEILALHIKAVRDLIPVNEQIILERLQR